MLFPEPGLGMLKKLSARTKKAAGNFPAAATK
jgi:hypothetical protein